MLVIVTEAIHLISYEITLISLKQGLPHKFIFDTKFCKTFVECQMCWERSKFACWRMQMQTSSHPYF